MPGTVRPSMSYRPRASILRAAFGLALPLDEESTEDEYANASRFDPKGRAYAEGGEVEGEDAKARKEAAARQLPTEDTEERYYQHAASVIEPSEDERRERMKQFTADLPGHAEGGEVEEDKPSLYDRFRKWLVASSDDEKAETSKAVDDAAVAKTTGMLNQARVAAQSHNAAIEEAARSGDDRMAEGGEVRDPEALAASIGREKYGAKKFGKLAHHADGGEVRPSFADAMVRRMKFRRSC